MSLSYEITQVSSSPHKLNERDQTLLLAYQNDSSNTYSANPTLRHFHSNYNGHHLLSSSKRRLSGDSSNHKRCKTVLGTENVCSEPTENSTRKQYPIFNLPDGSTYEQTPYGNLRTTYEDNAQISMIDREISLRTFTHYDQQASFKQQKLIKNHKNNDSHMNSQYLPVRMTPSPSLEVESYMIEGYRENSSLKQTEQTQSHRSERRQLQGVLNKSYDTNASRDIREEVLGVNYNLYDQSNEDLHLIEDLENEDDYEMGL